MNNRYQIKLGAKMTKSSCFTSSLQVLQSCSNFQMLDIIIPLWLFYLQDGIVKDGLWDVYNQIHMVCNDVLKVRSLLKPVTTYILCIFLLASVFLDFSLCLFPL